MGKFSITNLIMCVSKYQKLNSEDYIRLGLCLPDCQDCATGQGHYVKNDKMVKNNLLLNNQMAEDKLTSHHHNQHQQQQQQAPLKKIANNLANTTTTTVRAVSEDNNNNSLTCNPCKESQISNIKKSRSNCAASHCSSSQKAGVVNLAFVDNLTEQSSWYQPHLGRDLAVRLLADSPVGTFIVRNSRTQGAGHLALSVRVPRTYNTAGILHYLIMVTEAGFRIKGFSKVFSSLSGLVVHHSVMMESLPCRLLITSPTHHSDGEEEEEEDDRDSDFADLEADPEYPGLLSRLREQLSSD